MDAGADKPFRFKQFSVSQAHSAMRVGTDAVLLGCWTRTDGAKRILDVGTGTGVIALILAQRSPHAQVDAVEIDPGSAEDARLNIRSSPWSDRMQLIEGDFLQMQPCECYDLLISNPPYFSGSIRATDPVRSAARHDDRLPAARFFEHGAAMLSPGGRIAVIFPKDALSKWLKEAEQAGLFPVRICHVFTLASKDATRVMIEFSRVHSGEPAMESLLVEKSPGEFSEAYRQLTREFYTKWG